MKNGSANLLFIMIILLFVGMISLMVNEIVYSEPEFDEACKQLGFVSSKDMGTNTPGWGSCQDEQGNLNYVSYELSGYLWTTNVDMKQISVGDVRVK